ncbi:MAG: amino acid adenylation domain-containing protein, partial [Prevotellaceae bacterium]|nr:amino acid adenylation domain-containing protein [Prevotellaceae bacterium]
MKTYPLLQSQMGVFLDTIKYPNVMQYNLPSYAFLGKDVDADKLEQTIMTIFEKRRELHLSFMIDDEGNARQYFNPDIRFKVERKKMSEKECLDYINNGFVRPFDIFGKESLFRSELIDTEKGYYILFDMYHLVSDGMTYTPIFTTMDFPRTYAGEDLGDLSYGMIEAVIDEQASFGTEQYNKAKQNYAEKFAGMDFATLSADVSNPVGKMIRERAYLPIEMVDNWCKENGIAVNLLFQAAFSYAVSVVLGENKIAYTTVNHGRIDKRLRTAYGMYVRSVPILSEILPGMTVRDYIMSFRRELMSTIRNMVYPFNHLCSDLGMTPGISFNFQAIQGMDETLHFDDKAFPGIQPDRGDVINDLTAFIFLYQDQYEIRMESSEARNSRKTMRMLADAIKNALLDMMKNLDGQIDKVSILSTEETDKIMEVSAGKHLDVDITKTFAEVFIERAKLCPDAPAVVDAWSQFTYAELDRNSNVLSHMLIENGVEPNSFVCVMLDRKKEFPLAVLAIHKAGAAYTPLDFEYPNERLIYMIENSQSKVIVTTHDVLAAKQAEGDFNVGEAKVLYIDDIDFSDDSLPSTPINLTTPKNLAYMIYTSGSTGKPKGAILHQEGLWNFINVVIDMERLTADDRIEGHRSFSFDAHIEDMYAILTLGGSFHIMPTEIRKDLAAIRDFLFQHKITGGGYSTAIAALLLNTYDDLPVRFITAGGEKLDGVYSDHVEIINVYGPTECTDDTSYYCIPPGKRIENIPIGKPVANTWNFIVNTSGQLLPIGMIGELCIAGVQVGRGYWQLPERTAQSFVECPFISEDRWGRKVMMYHTGDLCRWNEQGDLEYIGRIDFQVKLRGFRIELGEIENKTLQIEGILQAVAEVKKVMGSEHLILYYTLTDNAALTDDDIRKPLEASSLADYMVPDTYMKLDSFPMTPNGKINRRLLPTPEIKNTVEYVEPVGEKEQALAEGFSNVLGVAIPIGALDNFFSLGGDSIKSIRLVSLLRQKGITLTVADVMNGKTVRAIADLAQMGTTIDIPQETVVGEIPNGAILHYFFNLNLPHAEHYNQSVAFECITRINTDALHAAIAALATHHDMLRMRAEGSRIYINNVDTRLYDFTEKDVESMADITAEADALQNTICLKDGPVLKVALFHAPDKDVLVMICHHLAVDGVSWRIIAEDLNNAYIMAAEGKDITLPKKTHSYKHYAEAITRYRDSYALNIEKTYWENVQKKMAALPMGGNNGAAGQMQKLHTSYTNDTIRHLLTDAHAAYNTNENDLLVTALVRSYRRLTGNNSASILMEGHGREPIHEPLVTDRTVGWFTSMYPVVVENLNGDIRHDLRTVKETFRNVPNKGLGYGILQYISSAEGDSNLRTDIKELLGLNYLGELTEASTDAIFNIDTQLSTGSMVNTEGLISPSFMIDCSVHGDTMNIDATYDSKAWTQQQANEMVTVFCNELAEIVTHTTSVAQPETTASDLGASGWTDEQFENITAEFAARGESIERIYPLSPMQEGMLLEYMMNPSTTSYVLLNRFAIDFLPTEEQMHYALDRLAAKHEVFRTSIIYNGIDNPWQAITDRKPVVKFIDISNEPDIMAASKRIHDEELHTGFNLQTDPLLRVVIMKTSDSSCHILFCTHHIIVDGWCLAIYFADFFTLLAEATKGDMNTQPEYTDKGRYEEAIRNILALDKKASLGYWKNLVGDYCEKAIIPYSADDTTDNSGEEQSVSVSAELEEKLKSAGSAYGVTLNTIIELVWGLVLQTYNRTDDVVFGKVVSGRNRGDVADLVGLFINTVPVRVRTDKDTTIGEVLQSLQQQASETSLHDYCALSEIQQTSDLGNDLFQSQIAFENYEGSDSLWDMAKANGVTIIEAGEENFSDLNISVSNGVDGQLQIQFVYDGRLYSYATIAQVKQFFCHLLEAIADNTDTKISQLPLVSQAEAEDIIRHSQGEKLTYDPNDTFVSLFLAQADKTPDAVAVSEGDSHYTYGELDALSNTLAHKLLEIVGEKNQQPGNSPFMSIMLGYEKDFLVAALAIERAGYAYVPLDYDYPNDRLLYMLDDSESQVLITSHNIYNEKTSQGDDFTAKNIIFIEDSINRDIDNSINRERINLATPDGLAYMIYTSGSTGKPKGVMIPHRAKANFIHFIAKEWHHTSQSRICCHSSFSFDASIEDLYPVLIVGGTLYIVPQEARKDISLLHDFIVKNGITGGCYTTQLGQMLLQQYPDLPVDYLVVGGEKMTATPTCNCRLINTYGPTEFTVDATYFEIEPGKAYKNIPIGRALDNQSAYVVDKHGKLLPQGVVGELCMSGVQMSQGYWKRDDLTAEKFTDCPFANYSPSGGDRGGRKMYHTGDLVRYNASWQLEYMGRIDSQVKLRGFRIELGEIETLIANYQGMNMVSVQVKEIAGVQHLCAYFTADNPIDTEALRQYLAAQLTDYMVPDAYMQLDEMPLTPNGKVNTKALPAPTVQVEDIVAPETETEKRLTAIVADILKTEQFGITTNLTRMGMTSLLSMRLAMAIQQGEDVQITVSELIAEPTVRAIAAKIDEIKQQEADAMSIFTKRKTTAPSDEKKADPFAP